MNADNSSRKVLALGLLFAACVALPANAESVAKKWRIGLTMGGYNPQDQITSDSANVLTLFERDFEINQVFVDPRDDSSVFGTLEIQPSWVGNLSGQYAVNNILVLEGSIGYTKADLGDVELQAQFSQIPIDEDFGFNFQTHRIRAGEVEIVPLQFTAIARFRPRAAFNPYIGAGIGYQFVGYKPTEEFNDLSRNMDASLGRQSFLSGSFQGAQPSLTPLGSTPQDLLGASVDVSDTFTYHAVLGFEYTFKPGWALVVDLRYGWSSRDVTIGFNGTEDLGKSVPFLQDYADSPVASETFGAYSIDVGGIVDGGSLQPSLGQGVGITPGSPEAAAFCSSNPTNCFFDVNYRDGKTDTGFYYVNGGTVDFESFTYSIGVRYTF